MARGKSKDISLPSRPREGHEPPPGIDDPPRRPPLRRALPNEAATVGNKALRAAFGAAAAAGLDIGALAASQGLRLEDLSDADVRVPHDAWVALFAEIERRTGDPGIGLHVAASLPLGHWDTIDYMIAASGTLGEALARLERYFALVSTAVEHTTVRQNGEVRIRRVHVAGSTRSRAGTELAVASIVRRFRALTAVAWSPIRVELAHGPSVAIAEYERELGCATVFHCREDAIVFAESVLAIPMARPEPELCAVLERHADALIRDLPRSAPDLAERVKRALASELHDGPPPLARIAKRLGIGARTLQRRLVESNMPFRALVEGTREALARRYLADPEIGLGEVGYLVGFSDPSAFYKAFRRWTGETPGDFRRRQRASGAFAPRPSSPSTDRDL